MEDLSVPVPGEPVSDARAPWLLIRADQIRQIARYLADESDDTPLTLQVRGKGYFDAHWQDRDGDDHLERIWPLPAPGD
jgi:hypothetical protein